MFKGFHFCFIHGHALCIVCPSSSWEPRDDFTHAIQVELKVCVTLSNRLAPFRKFTRYAKFADCLTPSSETIWILFWIVVRSVSNSLMSCFAVVLSLAWNACCTSLRSSSCVPVIGCWASFLSHDCIAFQKSLNKALEVSLMLLTPLASCLP